LPCLPPRQSAREQAISGNGLQITRAILTTQVQPSLTIIHRLKRRSGWIGVQVCEGLIQRANGLDCITDRHLSGIHSQARRSSLLGCLRPVDRLLRLGAYSRSPISAREYLAKEYRRDDGYHSGQLPGCADPKSCDPPSARRRGAMGQRTRDQLVAGTNAIISKTYR
jgi:hypothetical protein